MWPIVALYLNKNIRVFDLPDICVEYGDADPASQLANFSGALDSHRVCKEPGFWLQYPNPLSL